MQTKDMFSLVASLDKELAGFYSVCKDLRAADTIADEVLVNSFGDSLKAFQQKERTLPSTIVVYRSAQTDEVDMKRERILLQMTLDTLYEQRPDRNYFNRDPPELIYLHCE